MATLTVTATVELSNVPPRVRLDVVDSGTPSITAAIVTRLDPSGEAVALRTEDGGPLTLTTSGSTRVGTLFDYEMPYGQAVTYSTMQDPSNASAAVTVDEARVWLIHPGIPSRSVPIELMRGSFDDEEEDVDAGVFFPQGRRNAVVFTDGKRKAPSGTLIVSTDSSVERLALQSLLSDAFPLLLNVPPSVGIDVDTAYVHIGRLRRARPSDVGMELLRNWVLPFQVVEMPAGGSQSQWTWATLQAASPTWADVLANYPTWADVQAPTN